MAPYIFNRWLDLLDRTAWTFVQALIPALIAFGWNDWQSALSVAGGAALLAAGKTMAAQRTGDSPLGDAIPGASVMKVN